MSEERRIQNLLSALEERMRRGEISRSNYARLKNKFENKLTKLHGETGSMTSSDVSSEDSVFRQALEKVVTRVYACDYCGGVLDVVEGVGKAKCSFCGFVNEVDYLRRVSESLRAERAQIIKGAMDSFAKVTNLEQLKLPLHERFIATAHIYENRALRLEYDLGRINKYGDGDFQDEKEHYIRIEDKGEYYEASKSWHQVSELYRNAAEFAPSHMEMERDLAASHYYDGLAFFDVSFAPIRLMRNTFYLKIQKEGLYWPWEEETSTKTCETLEDLLIGKNYVSGKDLSRVETEIRKYAHPILIRPEATDASLHSALKATKCFLRAYETSKEKNYLVYALVSKLLVYMLYVESLRDSLVGPQILRNIDRICSEELYAPPASLVEDPIDERSLKHANSLNSIAKKFATFAISNFNDYILGFQTEWTEVAFRYSRINGRSRLRISEAFSIPLDNFINKIDRVFGQKTASFTLIPKNRRAKKNLGFKFSWILGRYKMGLFSYDQPGVYLTIESQSNQKGTFSTEGFFNSCFMAFKRLAVCPSILMNYLGGSYPEETRLVVYIKGTKDWSIRMTPKQFLDLYYSLCLSFKKIRHNSAQELGNKYSNRIKFVELWKKRTKELSKPDMPKILKGAKSQVLTPEFIRHDLDFLSFFADVIPTFHVPDKS